MIKMITDDVNREKNPPKSMQRQIWAIANYTQDAKEINLT